MAEALEKNQTGQILTEILVAITVFALVVTATITVIYNALSLQKQGLNYVLADRLVQDYQAAANSLAGSNWPSLSSASTTSNDHYQFQATSTIWQLVYLGSGSETVTLQNRIFNRYAYFSSVNRDGNNNIVQSGGTLDPSTLMVTVMVNWNGGTQTKNFYITRWINKILDEATWYKGVASTSPLIVPNGTYSSSTNITTSPGQIKLCPSGGC